MKTKSIELSALNRESKQWGVICLKADKGVVTITFSSELEEGLSFLNQVIQLDERDAYVAQLLFGGFLSSPVFIGDNHRIVVGEQDEITKFDVWVPNAFFESMELEMPTEGFNKIGSFIFNNI